MRLTGMDHIVLNVHDVERSLDFYTGVLGLAAERVEIWRDGKVGFPSVRLNETTLIDLAVIKDGMEPGSGTPNLNHFCLYTDGELETCVAELEQHGIAIETGPIRRWGARGNALSVYFRDPDSNEIEIRSYVSALDETQPAGMSVRAR